MSRVHLIYPHGNSIATPDAIGRNLGSYLARHHDVVLHDWNSTERIRPRRGDVLIGHPHPLPGTILRRSWDSALWSRRLLLCPYIPDLFLAAFTEPYMATCDAYLAITGKPWFDAVPFGPTAHWKPRMLHLDLAIDRQDFPAVKQHFNPPGQRRFLYIGHNAWYKSTRYLSEIAASGGGAEKFGWIGGDSGTDSLSGIAHLDPLGRLDTSTESTRSIIASYDFLLTVGAGDANPTTILEAMAWGLVPVCTTTSGYSEEPGIVNVPLFDVAAACDVLKGLDELPEHELRAMAQLNSERLDNYYCWDRFGAQVEQAVSGDLPLGRVQRLPRDRRLLFAAARLVSPVSPLRRGGRQHARALVNSNYPLPARALRRAKRLVRG